MDAETKKIIDEKIAALPPDVRNAISSIEVGTKITLIAKKYGLLLDQINDLYLEVYLAMIGLEPIEDLVENIAKNTGISAENATLIANQINNEVFLPIRESLMKLNEENQADENISSETLNKDQILAEIENPTPVVHPISIVDQTVPGPAKPREIITTSIVPAAAIASPVPTTPATNTKDQVAKDFISGKMTETVSLPSKKYSADPYREPVS